MRPGVLLAILVSGALLVFAVVFISPNVRIVSSDQTTASSSAEAAQPSKPEAHAETHPTERGELRPPQPSGNAPVREPGSESAEPAASEREDQHEASVAARIAELRELSKKSDPSSMATLLSEVRNPDPEIRQGSLDIISQSGNRAIIPGLIEAAAQTDEAREKHAIQEVIEFLKLPTLTEAMRHGIPTNSDGNPPGRSRAEPPGRP